MSKIDHIVVGAASLSAGVDYIAEALGVEIPKGGEHPLMGTHNHLMQLGDDMFLEVIAINPDAVAPKHPRWFALDDPLVAQSIKEQPRLLTWVANTTDLASLCERCEIPMGNITAVSRGELNWLFAVPEDGRLLGSGLIPYAMQWQTDSHPAGQMAKRDCQLEAITLHHANTEWIQNVLVELAVDKFVRVEALEPGQSNHFCVDIKTPAGKVTLSSKG